jgi:hypothetical protein
MMRMFSTTRRSSTTSKKNKKDKRGVPSRNDDAPSSANKNKNLHPPNDDEYDYYAVPRILLTSTTATTATTKEEFSPNPFCLDTANGSRNDFFIMMESEATLQFHELARQFVDFDVVQEPPKKNSRNSNNKNKSLHNNDNKTATTERSDQVLLLLNNNSPQTIETTITPPPVTTKMVKQPKKEEEKEEEEGQEHTLGAWNDMVANSSTSLKSKIVTWIANDDDETDGSNHHVDNDNDVPPHSSNELIVVPVRKELAATPSQKVMIVLDALLEYIDPSDPLQLASKAVVCPGEDYESFHSMLLPCLNHDKKGDSDAIISSLFSFADEDDEYVSMDMAIGLDEVSWCSDAVDQEEHSEEEQEKDTISLPTSDGSHDENDRNEGAEANFKNESNHQCDMFLGLEYEEEEEELGSTPVKDKAMNQTLVTTTCSDSDNDDEGAGDDSKNASMESDDSNNLLSTERASSRVMIKAGPTRVELLQDFLRLGCDRASI